MNKYEITVIDVIRITETLGDANLLKNMLKNIYGATGHIEVLDKMYRNLADVLHGLAERELEAKDK